MPITGKDVDTAFRVAIAHARTSRVEVRVLRPAEAQEAADLLAEIWAPGGDRPPLEASLLIALLHSDNYVAVARAGSRLVGVCVGFLTATTGFGLHSYIAGVRKTHTGRGIGAAIKLHQRAWSLQRGIESISWAYDPLVARNAYFSLQRLGARAVRYVPDFYGELTDRLNGGQCSDRLMVRWDITGWPPSGSDVAGEVRPVVEVGRSRQPVCMTLPPNATSCRIAIPDDIAALRVHDAKLATRWRHTTREAFAELLEKGWEITGFDRSGFYRLTKL